jgi:hypothetical protein
MKKILGGMAMGAALMGGVWGLMSLLGPSNPSTATVDASKPGSNKGVLDMICELSLDLDGQIALGITVDEPSRITMAQVDFSKSTGWYQGKIAISESRGGTLSVVGSKLMVSRPAMFQRFGVMINREEFTIDRKTGSFEQSISTQGGKTIRLIKGTCAQVIKPPF